MSFASDVKQELSKLSCLNDKEIVRLELIGYLISSNTSVQNKKIKFITENEYNINRFAKLLENIKIEKYKIQIQGKLYFITVSKNDIQKNIIKGDNCQNLYDVIKIEQDKININEQIQENEKVRALIRGVFLGSGTINNPQNKYHLEFSIGNDKNANIVKNILKNIGLNIKEIKNEKEIILYTKEGEEISNFLAYIEANKGVLNFEEIRVQKEMNNKINRIVNCKTANITKSINASIEQIEAIKKIQKSGEFENLDKSLKEIANARIKYPDISLIELGKKLENPIGKSGANYRMKKIIQIAQTL